MLLIGKEMVKVKIFRLFKGNKSGLYIAILKFIKLEREFYSNRHVQIYSLVPIGKRNTKYREEIMTNLLNVAISRTITHHWLQQSG